jgi:hypothetical protein
LVFFTKIIKTIIAIFIAWIIVYGIVYAQQSCSSISVDTCIRASNRTLDVLANYNPYKTSLSHHISKLPQSHDFSLKVAAEVDEKNTCCENSRCEAVKHKIYHNPPLPKPAFPLLKQVIESDDALSLITLKPAWQSTPLYSVPIYILTQSFIC